MSLPNAPGNFHCERCGNVTSQEIQNCPQNGCPARKYLTTSPFADPSPSGLATNTPSNPYAYSGGNATDQRTVSKPGSLLAVAAICVYWTGMLIPVIGGAITGFLRKDPSLLTTRSPIGIGLFQLTLLVLFAGYVLFQIWLCKTWSLVPQKHGRIHSALVLLLQFIPCFNIYWMIRIIPGLSIALASMRREQESKAREDAGLALAIAFLVSTIVAYFFTPAILLTTLLMTIWIIVANNAKNRYLQYFVVEYEEEPPPIRPYLKREA